MQPHAPAPGQCHQRRGVVGWQRDAPRAVVGVLHRAQLHRRALGIGRLTQRLLPGRQRGHCRGRARAGGLHGAQPQPAPGGAGARLRHQHMRIGLRQHTAARPGTKQQRGGVGHRAGREDQRVFGAAEFGHVGLQAALPGVLAQAEAGRSLGGTLARAAHRRRGPGQKVAAQVDGVHGVLPPRCGWPARLWPGRCCANVEAGGARGKRANCWRFVSVGGGPWGNQPHQARHRHRHQQLQQRRRLHAACPSCWVVFP